MKRSMNGRRWALLCLVLLALAAGVCTRRFAGGSGKPAVGAVGFPWDDYALRDEAWWGTDEAGALADGFVAAQRPDGGWSKGAPGELGGYWEESTIDNCATWGQIRFLAKRYAARGGEAYREACRRGIEYLLAIQYPNGGWPQIAAAAGTYHAHITFNDDAMTEVLRLMAQVAARDPEAGFAWVDDGLADEAALAFDRGWTASCAVRSASTGS